MSTQQLAFQDVFVPGGFPRHTYNPRVALQLEAQLAEVKDNLCKLVTVTGQTKSGKTVLAKKILPDEDSIWIDGGAVTSDEGFWEVVIQELELFQETGDESGTESAAGVSVDMEGEANAVFVKGKGKVGASYTRTRKSAQTKNRRLSSRTVAIQGLRDLRIPLVIDDFHYLPKDLQGTLIRALKPAVFHGVPVVVIAIPHRRYDAVKVEKEMTGRIFPINIPSWSTDELKFIPDRGFQLLGTSLSAQLTNELTDQAIGSPHLMQEFCRGICKSALQIPFPLELTASNEVFRDVAETIGRPIFEKLARGPRQRTDRLRRKLKNGKTVDIYQLVLHALASLKPGLVSIEYEELRSAIRDVSEAQVPQLHEVARVLKHMATIAATDQSSTPVIDFDDADKKLHVTDPFFAFYLRWGTLDAHVDD